MELLDILIGLFFIYTLLSLVCTTVNELVAQALNLRGTTLRRGIRELLEGPDTRGLRGRLGDLVKRVKKRPDGLDAERKAALKEREKAFNQLKAAASAEATALKDKLKELRSASAASERAKAKALAAATLAEYSRTEESARAAVEAAKERETEAKNLRAATEALLTARQILAEKEPEASQEFEAKEAALGKLFTSASSLYNHPLIAGLHPTGFIAGRRLPSYIPADTFALTLLDLIAPEGVSSKSVQEVRESVSKLPPQLQRPLLLMVDQAGDSLQQLQLGISRWFGDTMERVSGVYKRRTQIIILVLALGTTVFLNADTVRIWRALSFNATAREAVVSAAQALSAYPPEALQSRPGKKTTAPGTAKADTADTATARTFTSGFARLDSLNTIIDTLAAQGLPLGLIKKSDWDWARIPGWLITALAISLGAPFWFDLLNRVMNIRAAGRAPEERPKSPEALPPPRGA